MIESRINIDDSKQITDACKSLHCTMQELHYCMSRVGSSISAISCYLEMNRDRIEYYFKLINEKQLPLPKT
jgi:Protein of unknown function (DUF3606)